MLGGMRKLKDRVRRSPLWFQEHRALILAILVIGIFVIAGSVSADVPKGEPDFWQKVLGVLGNILTVIINWMGKLIIILVNILIDFAMYNKFTTAQPVITGWKLMRDVANMFFIVVLLLSAFSTIIGYAEYHYSKVLPKLLLMAVLINFSKTLIGLLIDFSQVVMLTFVNAFAQAAGGNFVSALQLNKVVMLDVDAEDKYNVENGLVPAAILGVVMLSMTLTILVIMIAFMMFRIIGLWMLLILSPMAFFAGALPGRLKSALSVFTKDFWDRLSNLLIAGPVMAFFLWLTLAVVQQGGENGGFSDMYSESPEASKAANFVSKVGNSASISTFIVAISMMLMGVKFAVSQANAVSGTLGALATQIAGGGGVAVHALRGLSRVGKKAGKIGFEATDRVLDIRGKAGGVGLAVSKRLGGVGAGAFTQMATHKGRREATKRANFSKSIEGLDPTMKMDLMSARGDKIGAANIAVTGLGQKKLYEEELAKVKKSRKDLSAGDQAAMAKGLSQKRAAALIQSGKEQASQKGDTESFDKYNEAIRKNPGLASGYKGLGEVASAGVDDVREYMRTKNKDSFTSSASAAAIFEATGIIKDGKLDQNEAYEKLKQRGGDTWKMANAHIQRFTENPELYRAQIAAMQDSATEADIKKATDEDVHFGISKGEVTSVNINQAAPKVENKFEQKFDVRQEAEIKDQKERLAHLATARPDLKANSSEAVEIKTNLMTSGAKVSEAFKYDEGNHVFENSESADAYGKTVENMNAMMLSGNQQSLDAIIRFDSETLKANPDNYNQARAEFVDKIDLGALKNAFKEAVNEGNVKAQNKIQEILKIVNREGDRSLKSIKDKGFRENEIRLAASGDPQGNNVIRHIVERDKVTEEQARQSASAVVKRDGILNKDVELRLMQSGVRASVERFAKKREEKKTMKFFKNQEVNLKKDEASKQKEAAKEAAEAKKTEAAEIRKATGQSRLAQIINSAANRKKKTDETDKTGGPAV